MRYCDVPEIAAARCSESQLFAVPGSPISRRARSEANVAMATCTRFRFPMYFGVIVTGPFGPGKVSVDPRMYISAIFGESCHPSGFAPLSAFRRATSSCSYFCSAGSRISSAKRFLQARTQSRRSARDSERRLGGDKAIPERAHPRRAIPTFALRIDEQGSPRVRRTPGFPRAFSGPAANRTTRSSLTIQRHFTETNQPYVVYLGRV